MTEDTTTKAAESTESTASEPPARKRAPRSAPRKTQPSGEPATPELTPITLGSWFAEEQVEPWKRAVHLTTFNRSPNEQAPAATWAEELAQALAWPAGRPTPGEISRKKALQGAQRGDA